MRVIKKKIYKPSLKAKDVYRNKDKATYRILQGAVRSSKSYTANIIAIKEIKQLPPCDVLISGATSGSVARNVIAEWKKLIGEKKFKTYKRDKDEYLTINLNGLRDKKFYIKGGSKEGDDKKIQGATFGYWYADEVTNYVKSFTEMAMTRLSEEFSKAIWTLNPDNPFHYIKKSYIDNENLYIEDVNGYSYFKKWHFVITDNLSLSNRYVNGLKSLFNGVFYKRYIEGLWVIAEGLVYDMFSDRSLVDSDLASEIKQKGTLYIGVDFGTQNATTFIKIYKYQNKYYILEEYYHSGRETNKQKTSGEYANDFVEFLNGEKPRKIFIDPSATNFKLELSRKNINGITNAKNNVLDGIRVCQMFLQNERLLVSPDCKNVIKEFSTYSWDEKASMKGEDIPIKENDHTMDGIRYVLYTLEGKKDISILWK